MRTPCGPTRLSVIVSICSVSSNWYLCLFETCCTNKAGDAYKVFENTNSIPLLWMYVAFFNYCFMFQECSFFISWNNCEFLGSFFVSIKRKQNERTKNQSVRDGQIWWNTLTNRLILFVCFVFWLNTFGNKRKWNHHSGIKSCDHARNQDSCDH